MILFVILMFCADYNFIMWKIDFNAFLHMFYPPPHYT